VTDVYAPPAFQFYARDFLALRDTMPPEQLVAWQSLRSLAWLAPTRGEPPCTVTADDEALARMSGLGAAKWRKLGPAIRARFRLEGDRLVDDELLVARSEMREFHDKKSRAGKAGAEKRWHAGANAPANGTDTSNTSSSAHGTADSKPIANEWPASASASASKSGAERKVLDGDPPPPAAAAGRSANGAAPPADAGAAEERKAPQIDAPLPFDAIDLIARMPDEKREDGERQLRDALSRAGARISKGRYVRAVNAEHLAWACRDVLDSPPDKAEQLARWVLLRLESSRLEWQSKAEKRAEQTTAPAIAAMLRAPVDAFEAAREWLAEHPEIGREIEAEGEAKFAGFPKTAGMLRQHSKWVDEQVVARWKAAGAPEPAAAAHGQATEGQST